MTRPGDGEDPRPLLHQIDQHVHEVLIPVAVVLLVAVLVVGHIVVAIAGLVSSVDNVWIAHLLLFSMFLSEVARFILQLVYYRSGRFGFTTGR